MQHKPIFKLLTVLILLIASLQLTGCGHVVTAIEHSDMQVKLKMTDTIFLDPVSKAKNRTVFVAVNNTSDLQEVDTGMLQSLIAGRLTAKGYQVVQDPSQAGYIIQANVLYMDYYRKTGTHEGALTGALVGGGAGALIATCQENCFCP